MDIGPTIRKLREARNITQEYMASRLNIGVTAYGNIERSDVKRLPVERVFEIAAILQVHYSEIFGAPEKEMPEENRFKMDACVLAMMEYFRKDKQLLCDMLNAYKEIHMGVDAMLQEHIIALNRIMKMQVEIHQSLIASTKQSRN